jgi:hypothetical protein
MKHIAYVHTISHISPYLGCRTGTGTGTGEPVPGPANPVVGNARWRRWDRKVKTKLGKQSFNVFSMLSIYKFMYKCGSRIEPMAQLMPACHLGTMDHPVATSARRQSSPQVPLLLRLAAGRWPNSSSRRPGLVGQSVCDTKTKLITGRYRPVPGTNTGAGRSCTRADPVTRWDNLAPYNTYLRNTSDDLDSARPVTRPSHARTRVYAYVCMAFMA